jgi:hypothetical protein
VSRLRPLELRDHFHVPRDLFVSGHFWTS